MRAYHLHHPCQFKHSKEFKAFKHKTRKSWTEWPTRAPCSVHTQRAMSHGQQDRTELSFISSCIWTNKFKSQFKQANRKRCERAKFSTRARCSVRTGRAQRDGLKCINTALDWITLEFNKNESSQTENYSDTKYNCLSFLLVGAGLYSSFMWGYQNKLWHIIPKDSSYSGLPVQFIKKCGNKNYSDTLTWPCFTYMFFL